MDVRSRQWATGAVGVMVALAAGASGCSRGAGPSRGACGRIVGSWVGDGIVADGGQDPEAIAVVDGVMREEEWRITRVIPIALQRERVGAAGGRVASEALYIVEERSDLCVVEIRGAQGVRTRTLRFHPRSDGRLDVQPSDAWYSLRMRRR